MAAISITAANVVAGTNARIAEGVLGAAGTQGQVVYIDATDGSLKLADADSATAAAKAPAGILLTAGAIGQPAKYLTSGQITIGGTLTGGLPYFLSPDTAGGIALIADVAVGDDYVLIGMAKSSTVLDVNIIVTGFTRAV